MKLSAMMFYNMRSRDYPTAPINPISERGPDWRAVAQVNRSEINENFFSEIRSGTAPIFDVVGRYIDKYGFLI